VTERLEAAVQQQLLQHLSGSNALANLEEDVFNFYFEENK